MPTDESSRVKLLIEILISILLHPLAMVLMWINLLRRSDLGFAAKIIWVVVSIIWGLGPILYILVGGGQLW
jgi:hypothetical protein